MSEAHKHGEGAEFKAPKAEHEPRTDHHEGARHSAETKHHSPENDVTNAQKKVESHAQSGEKLRPQAPTSEKKGHHPVMVNKHLKDMSYSRTMVRVQKKLSAPSRVFSKAVHSPVLDKPSEFIGKTVARPSSMLGGGLIAMIGTLLLFWTVNEYGYEYNYLAVGALFIAGALLGLLTEGIIRLLRAR